MAGPEVYSNSTLPRPVDGAADASSLKILRGLLSRRLSRQSNWWRSGSGMQSTLHMATLFLLLVLPFGGWLALHLVLSSSPPTSPILKVEVSHGSPASSGSSTPSELTTPERVPISTSSPTPAHSAS